MPPIKGSQRRSAAWYAVQSRCLAIALQNNSFSEN